MQVGQFPHLICLCIFIFLMDCQVASEESTRLWLFHTATYHHLVLRLSLSKQQRSNREESPPMLLSSHGRTDLQAFCFARFREGCAGGDVSRKRWAGGTPWKTLYET